MTRRSSSHTQRRAAAGILFLSTVRHAWRGRMELEQWQQAQNRNVCQQITAVQRVTLTVVHAVSVIVKTYLCIRQMRRTVLWIQT